MQHTLAAAALGGALLALAATAATAETVRVNGATDARSMVVRYDDLNLKTARGRGAVDARIHRAAELVCGSDPGAINFERSAWFKGCVTESTASARQRLDMQVLAAHQDAITVAASR